MVVASYVCPPVYSRRSGYDINILLTSLESSTLIVWDGMACSGNLKGVVKEEMEPMSQTEGCCNLYVSASLQWSERK